jgi:uncharacterized membrane protein
MPKLICVCVAFGSLVSGLVLWLTGKALPSEQVLEMDRRVFTWVMVPAIIGAIFFGLLLLLQHLRVFIRMRWLQIKLAVVAIFLPVVHAWVSSQLVLLGDPEKKVESTLYVTWLYIAVITLLLLIVLGRLKPRLGQNWAKDFPRR